MDVTAPAVEAGIHRQVRDLADRALAWLALREDGDAGVSGIAVELAERRTFEGRAGQFLEVFCERILFSDEQPGVLKLRLQADDDGVVQRTVAELSVRGPRKALRQVVDRLPKLPGKTVSVELARDPRLPKHDPSWLVITLELPAGDAIEDQITRGVAALDTLADESVSRDKKSRKRR
jgi:hypothetical protein